MKKTLFVALAAIALGSCEKEVKKPEGFLFSGEVQNFRKRNMTLKGFNFEQKIKFDRKTKTFSDSLKHITPGHYTLVIGKRPIPLYLTSTDDLKLTVDAKKRTKSPVFEGATAAINKYLGDRRKKFGLVLGNAQKFFAANEDDFLAKNNEYKETLTSLASSSQLPADYLEMEKRNIQYEWVRNINNYQKFHRILTGDDEFTTSSSFPVEIDKVDFNNSVDYANSLQYRNLLTEHLNALAEKKQSEDSDLYLTYLETIQTEVTDTLVKNNLIHDISEKALTYTTNLPEFYKKYMSYSTSAKNKRQITEMYNKLKLTATGEPSPKFENYESYEGGEKVSLDNLLNKGKYIYIDIWATWCGFCKKEIPLLKNFEVKYHGKNIEFVSINVDNKSNYQKWKKTVKDNEMGGVQLFAGDNERNLKFTQDYLIKGLPRFILLDPEGKIVSANAPRPSDDEKLHAIFEELGIDED